MAYKKSDIIKYRIEKAKSCYLEIDTCLEKNLFHLAENRIYYSLFYSVSALALLKGFSASKHKQLQGWFNREFIKTGIFPIEFAKIYSIAYERRQKGDYDDFVTFTKEEVENDYKNIQQFNEKIWEYIDHNLVE
jgi:uncharacterized protein (UPF0332 family)